MRLKQQELGEIMGITQPQVSAIMQGKKPLLEVHEIRLKAKLGNKIDKYTTDQPVNQESDDNTLPEVDPNNLGAMKRFFDALERKDRALERRDREIEAQGRRMDRLITIIERMSGAEGAGIDALKKEG